MVVSAAQASMQQGLGGGGGSWREHMPCLAWDATDIPQEELSLALSR